VFQHDEFRRQAAYEADLLGEILRVDTPVEVVDPSPRAQTVAASAIAPARFEWLWPSRIPLGTLTLFSGDPKLGKSLVALSVLAALSRGGPLPGSGADGSGPAIAPHGSALLLSAEDDPARTIVPRLIAAGADLDRIHLLSTMRDPEVRGDEDGRTEYVPARERMPTLSPDDLRAIERRAAELGDCRMIVIDPVTAYIGGPGLDVRRVLTPLRHMAERLGAAVVLITHHNKQGGSSTNGQYRVLGRIDYVAACRLNFLFLQDPDDPTGQRRLMLDNGGNFGPPQPALVYVVQSKDDSAYVEWLPETIDLVANAALARARTAGKTSPAAVGARRRECEHWLRGFLAVGPKTAKECEQAASVAGFNRRVLERARLALAVRCLRSGFGKGGCSYWSLPDDDERPDPAPIDHTSHHTSHTQDVGSMGSMEGT
jgi:putative DNA primase/helicase